MTLPLHESGGSVKAESAVVMRTDQVTLI